MRLQLLKLFACLLIAFTYSPGSASAEDWLQWRGPTGDQHAAEGATAPVEFNALGNEQSENFAWRTPVPGRGHSSPTLVGERIYLTTADPATRTQSLLIFDRSSGRPLKQTPVHRGVTFPEIHPNNSHASPTVPSDGERVFTVFLNNDALWLTALDLDGEPLWQERVASFTPRRFQFGYGASPVLAGGHVVVVCEYDGEDSGIYAFSPETGARSWKAPRPVGLSFSSAVATNIAGRDQLLLQGNNLIASYDPDSGEELWATRGGTSATCGTMVWDKERGLVFAAGGVPQGFVGAWRADGTSQQAIWNESPKLYEQSMLWAEGYLYGVSDRGIAYCWEGATGKEMWSERLGGRWSSSPVLVDGKIYVGDESGALTVFKATPEGYQELAKNQLGTDMFPTPTPADGRLYVRYGDSSGGTRQEYLAAIGE